jgi:hypothetical protein
MDDPVVDRSFLLLRLDRRQRIAAMTMSMSMRPAIAMPIAKSRCGKQIVEGS